ncbi:plasmid recombination protein [Rhodoferax sp.]|uniref:plasmid recombination protein n=1 Tax=Rhodoferax sp. TaxID=50421 RepID=UPI00261D5F1B|nr:plasmid recombination protein [Rhodoferax sp.]MDD2811065.1 plasmid recombination protein [Rhodoferax sp.]
MATQWQHLTEPQLEPGHGQFIRVEKFAVKVPRGKSCPSNIHQVANEAMRTPGFCDHIRLPVPPRIIYGVNPLDAVKVAESWSKRQTATVFHKPTQTVICRKFRHDKACAVVGVISVPPEWASGEMWTNFCQTSVAWLSDKYGSERLLSVVEHLDEHCLHLHFWIVPRVDETFSTIHQGVKAIEDVGLNATRGVREAAYKKAMSSLQDEFHDRVGKFFGLERLSVGRNRYTRAQWHQKCFFDKQREIEVQKRIEDAVARALEERDLLGNIFVDSDMGSQFNCAVLYPR